MRFGSNSERLGLWRRRLASSTALVGVALGTGATLVAFALVPAAIAAPGAGGAGGGTGGAGGAGGAAPGGAGDNGAAGTGGGTGGLAGGNGSGGGGGGGGAGGATGAATVTTAAGGAGGAGGAGSGTAGNAGGGGGGGEGGTGVISATGGTLAGTVTGGAGGAGGTAGPGATAGSGGDGGAGIVITGGGQTLTINGTVTGGAGGAAGGAGAAGGFGGAGVVAGIGSLTVVNNGTVSGGLGGAGGGSAFVFNGGGNTLTNNASGTINGMIDGVEDFVNNGLVDTRGSDLLVGSLSGSAAGAVIRGGGLITVNGNGSSTTYAGAIQDGSGQTALTKVGVGELILTGANTYTGATQVTDGVLRIAAGGSITGSPVTNDATLLVDAGGSLTATTVVNTGFFGVDGAVTATTSFHNFNVLAVTAPITTPGFLNVGEVSGILALNGLVDGYNAPGAFIADGVSIATGGSATFYNDGTIGSGGLALANRGGSLTVTNASILSGFAQSLAATSTLINNAGTWFHTGSSTFGGNATIANSGTFQASGSVSGLTTFDNSETGQLFVAAPFGGSIGTVNNRGRLASGGGIYLEGRSFPTVSTFNNDGYLRVGTFGGGPANVTLAAATFNNQAGGRIDMTGNGSAADRLTIGGNFVGSAGSRVAVDVDLSQGATRGADQLVITGTNSGRTILDVNRIDNPRVTAYSSRTTPIPVVVAGGGSGEVVLGNVQRNGIVAVELRGSTPGSYELAQTVDTQAAAGAPNLFRSIVNTLNIGFFDSMSALFGGGGPGESGPRVSSGVSSGNASWAKLTSRSPFVPDEIAPPVTPDTTAMGLWANGGGGELVLRGTDTADVGGNVQRTRSRSDVEYAGLQVGIDAGWFNIDNSGWNARVGVMGGSLGGRATQGVGSETRSTFDVPFVGVYAAVDNGRAFADLSYRHDFIQTRLTNTVAGLNDQRANVGADTISGTLGYRFGLGELVGHANPVFAEPSGTIIYTRTEGLNVPITGGNLQVAASDTVLGRVGVRIGTTLRPNGGVILQPFVSASVWNDFSGDARTRFVSANVAADPAAFVPILSDRLGTFGQAGGGLAIQVVDTPVSAFVKAETRFGDRIEGYTVNGGARYQF